MGCSLLLIHCYGDGCAVSGQQRCSECVEGGSEWRLCVHHHVIMCAALCWLTLLLTCNAVTFTSSSSWALILFGFIRALMMYSNAAEHFHLMNNLLVGPNLCLIILKLYGLLITRYAKISSNDNVCIMFTITMTITITVIRYIYITLHMRQVCMPSHAQK